MQPAENAEPDLVSPLLPVNIWQCRMPKELSQLSSMSRALLAIDGAVRTYGDGRGLISWPYLEFLVVLFPIPPLSASLSAAISGTTPLLQTTHCVPPHADSQNALVARLVARTLV